MLSITLPTISEKITLNGVEVEVRPLPLFFSDRIGTVMPAPPEDDKTARTIYYTHILSARVVEALGLSKEVGSGRPDWDDSAAWPLYALACTDALEASGFTAAHINAVSDALERLEARQIEALEPVGNS